MVIYDNILIDANEDVLLSDFGLSVFQTVANSSFKGSRSVNPHYCAPELIEMGEVEHSRAPPQVRKPSDIYAFACFCIEYYSGDLPWAPYMNEHKVLYQRIPRKIDELVSRGSRPKRPYNPRMKRVMSDSLWDLVNDCWDQDPRSRPNAWELFNALTITSF